MYWASYILVKLHLNENIFNYNCYKTVNFSIIVERFQGWQNLKGISMSYEGTCSLKEKEKGKMLTEQERRKSP